LGEDPVAERGTKDAVFEQFTRVAKALSNPKRLVLVDLLAQGERSVERLAEASGQNLTTCSAHLQALRQARLVTTRRDGTKIFYRLAGPDVAALYLQLQRVTENHLPDLGAARDAFLGIDDTEAIGRDELWDRLNADEVAVIDVRPGDEYAQGHLPGAISVPLDQLADRIAELPADAEVVAYCRGPYCVLSFDAVRLLRERGLTARRLADGVLEWQAAELPIVVPDAA
jgi:rhodanese-related sulfurtransferase/DNA-binding transcriptional ArsR family regulator